ncbi:hypothetical protein D9M69_425670 [compost metagenome]
MPFLLRNFREVCVAFRSQFHAGEVEAVGPGKALGIELGAADQHQLRSACVARPGVGALDGSFQAGEDFRAFQHQSFLATDHQVEPARQRAAKGVPGLAPHDDRLAEGHGLEVLEVRRQVPGQLVVAADHAVLREGGDQAEGQGLVHGGEDTGCRPGEKADDG